MPPAHRLRVEPTILQGHRRLGDPAVPAHENSFIGDERDPLAFESPVRGREEERGIGGHDRECCVEVRYLA